MQSSSAYYGVDYTPSEGRTHPWALRDLGQLTRALRTDNIQYIRLQWVDFINNTRYRVLSKSYFIKLMESPRPGITMIKVSLGGVFDVIAPGFSAIGEFLYVPDISSYRVCPYAPGHASIMGFFQEKIPSPDRGLILPLCPRTILQRIVE